jgi:hypothetical protein
MVLPTSIVATNYFITIRTYNGTTKYVDNLLFAVKVPLKIISQVKVKKHNLIIEFSTPAYVQLYNEFGQVVKDYGYTNIVYEPFYLTGKYFIKACKGEDCVDSKMFSKK